MQTVLRTVFALVMVVGCAGSAFAAEGVHKLALQISDASPQKMSTVLNVAANVSRYYTGIGEQVEIQIIAFNAGLNMLRPDKSPVAERMKSFAQSMPNVSFDACENTMDSMAKKEGKEIPLFDHVKIVPAGVVKLIELNEKGWTIVRP